MKEKGVNKYAVFFVGLIWCVAVCYGMYFYYTLVMGEPFSGLPEWVINYILYFVGLAGVIAYAFFDSFVVLVKKVIDRYLGKVLK